MRAAWYERPGPAAEVLQVGEIEEPQPGPGEVLVRVVLSGVNPGDTKKRGDWFKASWAASVHGGAACAAGWRDGDWNGDARE